MLLGAVGQLQFEVVQHRLKAEYDADVRLEGSQYTGARWISADTRRKTCATLSTPTRQRMARDAADTWPTCAPARTTCAWRRSAFQNSLSPCVSTRAGLRNLCITWVNVA